MSIRCTSFLVVPRGAVLAMTATWIVSAGEVLQLVSFCLADNNSLHFRHDGAVSKCIESVGERVASDRWRSELSAEYFNAGLPQRNLRFLTVRATFTDTCGAKLPVIERRCGAFLR